MSKIEYLNFDGFSFPVLPSLLYQVDGPDKKNPDRFFIEDKAGRFLFYFEARNNEKNKNFCPLIDYDTIEISCKNKHLILCYPLQKVNPEVCTGYFHIGFEGENDDICCCGNLSIHSPESYFEGLRKYDDLYILFKGLEIKKK